MHTILYYSEFLILRQNLILIRQICNKVLAKVVLENDIVWPLDAEGKKV